MGKQRQMRLTPEQGGKMRNQEVMMASDYRAGGITVINGETLGDKAARMVSDGQWSKTAAMEWLATERKKREAEVLADMKAKQAPTVVGRNASIVFHNGKQVVTMSIGDLVDPCDVPDGCELRYVGGNLNGRVRTKRLNGGSTDLLAGGGIIVRACVDRGELQMQLVSIPQAARPVEGQRRLAWVEWDSIAPLVWSDMRVDECNSLLKGKRVRVLYGTDMETRQCASVRRQHDGVALLYADGGGYDWLKFPPNDINKTVSIKEVEIER